MQVVIRRSVNGFSQTRAEEKAPWSDPGVPALTVMLSDQSTQTGYMIFRPDKLECFASASAGTRLSFSGAGSWFVGIAGDRVVMVPRTPAAEAPATRTKQNGQDRRYGMPMSSALLLRAGGNNLLGTPEVRLPQAINLSILIISDT